jgi:catechol 2,3-dioxygenase
MTMSLVSVTVPFPRVGDVAHLGHVELLTPIETGPHKHAIGQTFFLYCYEPGGNRFEIGAGGYMIVDPAWKPVVWTEAERAKGQAWA